MKLRSWLFTTAALLSASATWAQDEEGPSTPAPPVNAPTEDAGGGEEILGQDAEESIVVVGQRARGSVIGDIPAEDVLDRRDIRATGATSISELIEALSPQTGSARGRPGGRPILLLNGLRISGFRELRDLPPEAIERMEILPEEVALKYGYSADQRVVNIVLRRRFNSTSIEARGRAATEGGYVVGQAEATRLLIRDGQRTSLNLRIDGNSALTEAERDIVLADPLTPDERGARTLIGQARSARLTGTVNRTILGDVSATLTGEVGRTTGRSRLGLDTATFDPLGRRTTSTTAALGFALNTQRDKWRLSSTGNADLARSETRSDRDLASADDHSRSNRRTLSVDGTATGPLFELPAGAANATFKVGLGRTDLDGRGTRAGVVTPSDLGRTSGESSVSLDLPILKRDSKVGRLTANANAGVTQLSDFGTLTSLGAGLSWAPTTRLNVITSWTREEGSPSLQQLGDPFLETPGVRFFDAVRGETVDVTTITGGNPDLDADRRNVIKLGANWRPFEETDLRLRADYVRQSTDRPQASFPAATAALEDAFRDRFVRNAPLPGETIGQLVSVDIRPVNSERSRRDTLRWGFDFTKPLKSTPPSAEAIAAMRARFAASRPQGEQPGTPGPEGTTPVAPGAVETPPNEGRRFGGGGRGGGGRFGGGRQGGRLTLSMTHSLNLVDQVTIADGIDLDYLDGEALGQAGGRPRHELEVEAGYFNNALGARLSADWRSATRVDSGLDGEKLRFSSFAKVNLRLFANLGEKFELVATRPWLRGTSVQLNIDNLFNARPKVRDAEGATPFSYQPGLLEPTGRTVGITLRKLFIPIRFYRGGARERRRGN